MRHGLDCHHPVRPGLLPLVEALDDGVVADREVGRLDEGPRQPFVPVLCVALALLFPVAQPLAPHAPAVRGEVPRAHEPSHIPGFQQHRQTEGLSNTTYPQQVLKARIALYPGQHRLFEAFDLLREAPVHPQVALRRPRHERIWKHPVHIPSGQGLHRIAVQ